MERTKQTLLSPHTFWHNEVPKESGTFSVNMLSASEQNHPKAYEANFETMTCCCHRSPTHVNKTKNEQVGTNFSHLYSKAPYVMKELSLPHIL